MAGTPKPIGRILIIPKGNYDPATPYNSLDLVRYDSKSWLCKTDGIIGITPTEGTDWTLMTEDGTDGTDGRGIVNIQRTGTDPSNPLKDIYTITYTDGTTSTFTVTNGSGGGTTADTMLKSVYDKDDDGIVDKADTANTATNATDATNAKNLKKSDGTIVDADTITTKLSKVDTTDNLSVELGKKIDKPTSATDGQVLTYNGTSNEWEAQDSQGGSASDIIYDNLTSGLAATNVQSAVDEVTEKIAKISGSSGFPNYANPIMDITAGMTWTVTEDCWIIGYMGSNSATTGTYIKIDGVIVIGSYSNTTQHQAPISLPVRKGAVIETRGGDVMIYNLKAYATI